MGNLPDITCFSSVVQVGNVYIKFRREEDAEKAVKELNNRWFGGRPVYAELSPVTDFREACCREFMIQYQNVFPNLIELTYIISQISGQYEMGECTRSGFCNFMHLKPISRELRRELYGRGPGAGGGSGGGYHRSNRDAGDRGGGGGGGGGGREFRLYNLNIF